MKKVILLLIVLLALPCFSASDAVSNFEKANSFYKKGDYLSAIADYNKILESGFESSDIYFNLGNCYYKLNKTADAILSFERAKMLSPGDEDIDFNLKIANMRTIDRFQTIPKPFFIEWYASLQELNSSGTWAVYGIVLLFVASVSSIGFILVWSVPLKKTLFAIAVITLIISIFSFISANQKYNLENTRDYAIVYNPSVYVKSSPDEKSTDLFILHEGTKLKVLDSVSGWLKIRLANGNLGWLPEKTIKII